MKKHLRIKQLSPSGQLVNCINCYEAQISVLRTVSRSAIQPYLNALHGIPGPEKFIIEIDEQPYSPEMNILIGFGERFSTDDGTVRSFLSRNNVPANMLDSLLFSHGLENLADAECHKLNRCEDRRLRILAAVYSSEGALILNDPFDPISSEWRERFAELLVNFARNKKRIVLVPFLSYRPEYWIDNEFIARIQVGESLQKTIGLPSQAIDIKSALERVREEHKKDSQDDLKIRPQTAALENAPQSFKKLNSTAIHQNETSLDHEAVLTQLSGSHFKNLFSGKRSYLTLSGAACLMVIFVVVYAINKKSAAPEKMQISLVSSQEATLNEHDSSQKLAAESIHPAEGIESILSHFAELDKNIADTDTLNTGKQLTGVKVSLLSHYPQNIQDSIKQAVYAQPASPKSASVSSTQTGSSRREPKKNQVASDFLKLLETAGSDSADDPTPEMQIRHPMQHYRDRHMGGAPVLPHEYSADGGDEQARREQIRQKFLEAIQRAQEKG